MARHLDDKSNEIPCIFRFISAILFWSSLILCWCAKRNCVAVLFKTWWTSSTRSRIRTIASRVRTLKVMHASCGNRWILLHHFHIKYHKMLSNWNFWFESKRLIHSFIETRIDINALTSILFTFSCAIFISTEYRFV